MAEDPQEADEDPEEEEEEEEEDVHGINIGDGTSCAPPQFD